MKAIEVHELTRRYGKHLAVKGISFEVHQGEIFGFLGPNGAGKSTTIGMLATLLRPTSGSARVAGHDVFKEPDAVRSSIGMIFQDPSLDTQLSAWENLFFHSLIYDLPRERFEERARELLAMMDLSEKTKEVVKNFSGGMKRRLEIARGLLHHPKVLFLDEPTVGLDPQTRRHIWEYLIRLREQTGVTLFMTTHYMDEAEYCDRVAIMDHGQIVAFDTPERLKALVGGDLISFRTEAPGAARELLRNRLGLEVREGPEGELILESPNGEQLIPRLVALLQEAHLKVNSVGLRRPTLEDVFIKLTGRAIREEEASALDRMREFARRRGR
jgi:ABC-2 type transport system ATP-binding protein